MYTNSQRQTEYARILTFVVENGRVDGADSCVEEMMFEIAEEGWAGSDIRQEVVEFVTRHYRE